MGSRTWHWPGVLLGLLLATAGAQADTLRVATLDWAPYVGPDLPGKGLASRILDEALALDGHRAELVFLPWQRALKEAAEGRFDALMPAYLSPERRELFHATIPLLDSQLGFFRQRERLLPVNPAHLESLRPYRIGVVRGYVNREDFDADRSLTKDAVTNDWQNLEKLLRGRIDLAVVDRYTGYYLLARNVPALKDRLVFIEPPLEVKPLYVLVPKRHARGAALAASLDRNLRLMRRSGRLEQLIAEAHLERSGQTRTLAVDPLTGQADQQRSPGQEQDQGQHAPLQPAWREDPLGMR
ncbi:ABC transporter substrate-binding protein [Pseudomonas aeruginosa]|uniref:substrate-binding periplasmic protein n=1 Tax=Pseudomonas aeruginosa TaxID=287 RepID=UPI00053EE88B|nr:transporter substrate-binding domain-containing protein [Pseudomonas aeruginosa]EKU9564307.1 transporter substrate-binding domain-containing protein [Pseudomonas aeruginosa]MBG5698271.1 transporter substrate-binding domain-containing protein [Pseudomonas aeruginosa]MCS8449429.1 transporter substrate-binding domain-containing protein [Pseudomonas aeruginosa]MCT5887580.1 transporter substrate-binding domain-containing protein [Pseudomonas aeruginosa]MDK2716070.1 transporter substrate-binding 